MTTQPRPQPRRRQSVRTSEGHTVKTASLRSLTHVCLVGAVLLGFTSGGMVRGQASTSAPQSSTASTASGGGAAGTQGQPMTELTDAEKLVRLQRSIDDAKKQLEELQAKLKDPESEYAKAEAEFSELDKKLEAQKKSVQADEEAGRTDDAATAAKAELERTQKQHGLARQRFDLAIQARKTLQEQIATLEQRIVQDEKALKTLKGEAAPAASRPSGQSAEGAGPSAPPTVTEGAPSGTAPPASPVQPEGAKPAAPAQPAPAGPSGKPGEKPPSAELIKAREEAESKQAEAQQAQEQVASISERIDALNRNIAQESKLISTAQQQADNAQETERALYEEMQRKWQEGVPQSQLTELYQKMSEARARMREARAEIRTHTERIAKLQGELSALQSERIIALEESQRKEREAAAAQKQVERIENPFAPRNLLRWGLVHGPRIFAILLGMFAVLVLARLIEKRVIKLMAHRGERGSVTERENRARTLVGVFHNAVRVVVIPGGVLMILADIGANIIPLMGGAAVAGLAVAFGAQNLIRDYFTGFIILLENQYGLNDVVTIAGTSGQVERVTMRVTVLRDLGGVVHFIPNGHITTVSNMTHGWSRAVFDIGIAYKEDTDRVSEVLKQLGTELRRDPDFQDVILSDPEMLGVDAFGDSAVVIKFFMTTRPLMQWTVKREMLRRIKRRFDELGIEIPFPHRTVYHRFEHGEESDSGNGSSTAQEASIRRTGVPSRS